MYIISLSIIQFNHTTHFALISVSLFPINFLQDNLIDSHNEFIPICTIDMWPKELRDDFNLLYIDLMKELKTEVSLQPLQRQYFEMIDDHGGGCMVDWD